ncbi:MAG: nuclear transport factor 2 family protein [Pseudomonadota bacterium]
MADEQNALQQVLDRQALQDVMLRYAAGVDERDRDLYRSCFAEDVEVLDFGSAPVHGIDAWVDFVWEALKAYGPTQHMLGPQYAEIDGDHARTRSDVQALHYMADAPQRTLTLWATYETEMRRTADGWKISRHRLVPRGTRIQDD